MIPWLIAAGSVWYGSQSKKTRKKLRKKAKKAVKAARENVIWVLS